MVTSHTLTPMPASTQHRQPGRRSAPAVADAPSTAIDPPESVTGADGSPDAVALVWDLTVHRLHQAFAESLVASPDATQGGQRTPAASMSPAGTGLAGVRLAATRHAVNDVQDALRRMAAGSYGTCEQCGQPITTERLQAAPTTRWCPACQADRCG
jgi:Prokaryotic dksA/traR C4-type zinc finger